MGSLVQRLIEEEASKRPLYNKGNYGLTYQAIYSRMNIILNQNYSASTVCPKAARLLYVAYGIEVVDKKFSIISIGGVEAYIVDQPMDDKYDHYPFDIAKLDNQPILFVFKNCMLNSDIPKSIRISNIYILFDALVSIMNDNPLLCCPYTINSTIANYAPYVLTVRSLMNNGIEFGIEDILYAAPDDDKYFINDTTFDLVKRLDMNDLLVYGALCEYID